MTARAENDARTKDPLASRYDGLRAQLGGVEEVEMFCMGEKES